MTVATMNNQQFPQSSQFPPLENTQKQQKAQELIEWLEDNSQFADLVQQAKTPNSPPKPKAKPLTQYRQQLLGLIIAQPSDFHGTAFVPKTLKKHSRLTATLVSVSSLFNCFTNMPLLVYAFNGLGLLSWPFALLANGLILNFTNGAATAVSGRKRGNEGWSNWAIWAMLSLNLLQSFVAGVGTELMLNQSALSQLKAEELIEKKINRVEDLKTIDSPQYEEAKSRCSEGEQALNRLDRSNPRWDSLYTELYGKWVERNSDWSQISVEQLPICRQVERLRADAYEGYETAKAELEEDLLTRNRLDNDLAFLRQEMPLTYSQHFKANEELKSGIEASRLAILNFLGKLTRFDLAGLGFPLFFLLLSLLTSGFACALTIQHSQRKDTQMSFSDAVEQERDRLLEEFRQQL